MGEGFIKDVLSTGRVVGLSVQCRFRHVALSHRHAGFFVVCGGLEQAPPLLSADI